jgi:hypothetical protein
MSDEINSQDSGNRSISIDADGTPILRDQGYIVTHPDYMKSMPYIERERMSYGDFCARAAEKGLPTPSAQDWNDSFDLTDSEINNINALIEGREQGDLCELDRYFFVRHFGNKPRVCWRQPDGLLGHMSVGEFKIAHLEKFRLIDKINKPPKRVPLTDIWLHHEKTRRHDRVEFLPGAQRWVIDANIYNLWAGWPDGLPRDRDLRPLVLGDVIPDDDCWDHEEAPKECSLFLDHILHNMCDGDAVVYQYLIGWMAEALIRPSLSETALVLTGPSGGGKGTFSELFGSFFGPHYLKVNDGEKLVGKFNRHLMEAQLVFADEVDFKDNNQASKTLRNLVTEPTLQVEPKGVDAFQARKWFRIVLASNDQHIINALQDDRRYLVLRVDAGEYNQDRGYFAAMRRQWKEEGQIALFRWLTGRYWTEQIKSGEWDVGQRPVTAELQEQKEMSLSMQDQFLLGILENGVIPGSRPRNRRAPPGTVLSNSDIGEGGIYQLMRTSTPGLRNESDQRLAATLKRWSCRAWVSHGERGWTFPELADMRAAWDRRFGERAWPGNVVTWFSEPDQEDVPF